MRCFCVADFLSYSVGLTSIYLSHNTILLQDEETEESGSEYDVRGLVGCLVGWSLFS